MPLVCVCSPKGGVGKTTVVANLAWTLASSGLKVLAVDFDVQNALRLHFGVPMSDGRGYVAQATSASDWGQFILKAHSNLFILPYGETTQEQRGAFDQAIGSDEHFIQRGLNSVLNYPDMVVIADFPPGPAPALKAIRELADMHIVVMLADTASLSLLPQMENHKFLGSPLNSQGREYYIVNQSDMRRPLNRDVTLFFEQRLGDKLLGTIHRDECVPEANASQQSIHQFSPVSAAAFDIDLISKKVAAILDVNVGGGEFYSAPKHSLY
ncbi:cellulose synthase operon protein YhjQ [Brenneria izadpanahii]|uniref:Cellulose synthase operon protein YhjQ n=1 Tax=Brenneria izadpanahii TaxID=2722756 RepID=A0ABX7UX90_9GAMM|nr:cellulose biosynthesis protein BcsQ [Brenneria izadpanahii]QTF09466.1 cellulose synthase operon protein YhjQ [Brenneria izadpanahii]